MSRFAVTVLHNVSPDTFFRYHPDTSRLYHAHLFQVEADNVEHAANLVWVLTNVGDAQELYAHHPNLSQYADQVTAYRQRMNRSLSMSDVLVVHEVVRDQTVLAGVLVVKALGHEGLEFMPDYVDGDNDSEVSRSYEAHQIRYGSRAVSALRLEEL